LIGRSITHEIPRVSPWTIFLVYLRLGCTSLGGPIAHLGYFHEEFVVRREWLDEKTYTGIVGLCQFLPSALLMFAVTFGHTLYSTRPGSAVVHALELVAVAVIAQAIWTMMRTLTQDLTRMIIGAIATAVILISGLHSSPLAAIALGGALGMLFCRSTAEESSGQLRIPISHPVAIASLLLFVLLLVGPALFLTVHYSPAIAFFEAYYRSGALVFGGGHVVLPLLQAAAVNSGWTDNNTFLAGYGAAQALPGPLFSFCAYLGAVVQSPLHGALGAAIATIAIFLPGLLLAIGVLPFWNHPQSNAKSRAAFAGVNASVVGILLAALCRPVWTSAVLKPSDIVVVFAAFPALTRLKAPPWMVVITAAVAGAVASFS